MDRRSIAAIAAWFVFATANISWADGVIRDGIGARPSGRGGTNIAFEDNGEILLDNPAGMIAVEGDGLIEAGIDLLLTDLKYGDADNPVTSADNDPFPAAQLSYIRTSDNGIWAYGVGIYSIAGFSAKYDLTAPAALGGGPQLYKTLGAMGKVLPGVACNVTDRFAVGGTFGVGFNHIELEAPYFLQAAGPLQGLPTLLDLQATGAAPAWSVGMRYDVTDSTVVGVAYQGETRYHLDGTSSVTVPLLGSTRYDTQVDLAWPQSLGVGMRHNICQHRIVGLDVVWFDWSQAFDEVVLDFSQPSNPAFPSLAEQFPLHWRDSVSTRLGYERKFDGGRVARVGYTHHRNPVPDATLAYVQATLEHAFSVGYGWETAKGWEIDLAYQFSFGADRQVAASDVVGGDFNGATHESQVHWVFLSLLHKL